MTPEISQTRKEFLLQVQALVQRCPRTFGKDAVLDLSGLKPEIIEPSVCGTIDVTMTKTDDGVVSVQSTTPKYVEITQAEDRIPVVGQKGLLRKKTHVTGYVYVREENRQREADSTASCSITFLKGNKIKFVKASCDERVKKAEGNTAQTAVRSQVLAKLSEALRL